jgi:hypothetical protein
VLLAAGAAAALGANDSAMAGEAAHYGFPAAAQEITQLFWLAETASACGWATREEAERFELFAVRFLAAHLEGVNKVAFVAMAADESYLAKVQRVAVDYATDSCKMARWQTGWLAYKAAADENEIRY